MRDPHSRPTRNATTSREEILSGFEEVWFAGDEPQIEEYLTASETEQHELLPALIQIDIEFRFRSTNRMRVEEYLARFPELRESSDILLELLSTEFRLRCRTATGCVGLFQTVSATRQTASGSSAPTHPSTPGRLGD